MFEIGITRPEQKLNVLLNHKINRKIVWIVPRIQHYFKDGVLNKTAQLMIETSRRLAAGVTVYEVLCSFKERGCWGIMHLSQVKYYMNTQRVRQFYHSLRTTRSNNIFSSQSKISPEESIFELFEIKLTLFQPQCIVLGSLEPAVYFWTVFNYVLLIVLRKIIKFSKRRHLH